MSMTSAATPTRLAGDRCPGALRLHEAADGMLARIRVPGGLLTADQVDALAAAAVDLGDGHLSLTARGNLEIRGLPDDGGDRLARVLDSVGLLPSATHERVRNIVASPAAGVDDLGISGSLVPTIRSLDQILCDTARAADLSGRFLFGLDDGRGDVLALQPDVTAAWVTPERIELYLGATAVLSLPADQAPAALVAAAVSFLNARDAVGETGWRIAELTNPHVTINAVVDTLDAALPDAERLDTSGVPNRRPDDIGDRLDTAAPVLAPGTLGDRAVVLAPLLGSAPASTWAALASIAAAADGLVRTTPARSLVLAGLTEHTRAQVLADAASLGLVCDVSDPAYGVSACTGLPGCASSARDVRSEIGAALDEARHKTTRAPGRLPVHVSGCDRRCGHPRVPHREAVARHGDALQGPYATGLGDGLPATGAPLADGRDDLIDLVLARPSVR